MIAEFIAEWIVKPVLEIVLGGIAYHSGALVLSILTFGAMPLAPLDSLGDRNPGKLPWHQAILWRSRRASGGNCGRSGSASPACCCGSASGC